MQNTISNATAKPVSVKLAPSLKARLDAVAAADDRTPHAIMLAAIEDYVAQKEYDAELLTASVAACEEYDLTGLHVTHEEMEAWMAEVIAGRDADFPKCHT
jgi:predicted transcriptional regulator